MLARLVAETNRVGKKYLMKLSAQILSITLDLSMSQCVLIMAVQTTTSTLADPFVIL